MYKYNFWNKSIARLKKLRQIAKADDGVHSIEEILLAKKAVKKPKEKFDLKGFIEISKKVRRVIDEENQPSSVEECEKYVEKSDSEDCCKKCGGTFQSHIAYPGKVILVDKFPSKPRIEPYDDSLLWKEIFRLKEAIELVNSNKNNETP